MDYPSLEQVEQADREQIYRWFLLLPIPKLLKTGKGKDIRFTHSPEGSMLIIKRIFARHRELGGRDPEMANRILREGVIKIDKGTE
jgi:hypothetical protein